MKNILNENIILSSVPIIGVLNKVINSNLEIVSQVEFYPIYYDAIDNRDPSSDLVYTPDFIYELVRTRAFRLSSLSGKMEEDDFNVQTFAQEGKQEFWKSILDSNIKLGVVKEIVVINSGGINSKFIVKPLRP